MPPRSAVSCRDPRVSHTPMLMDRTWVISSVTRRRPLPNTSLTIGEFAKMKRSQRTGSEPADVPQTIDREGITSLFHTIACVRRFYQAGGSLSCREPPHRDELRGAVCLPAGVSARRTGGSGNHVRGTIKRLASCSKNTRYPCLQTFVPQT